MAKQLFEHFIKAEIRLVKEFNCGFIEEINAFKGELGG